VDVPKENFGNALAVPVEPVSAPAVSIAEAGRIVLTRESLHAWGVRSVLSLLDQGLTSGAGFAVNLLLARWLPAEIYGAFAVAFAVFLFIAGFHNVLLLEPLSIFGPSRYGKRLRAYFRAQVVIHTVMVGGLSVTVLLAGTVFWRVVSGSALIVAMVGSGFALPFLLLVWLARRMCYVLQQPSIAVAGSVFYLAFVVAGLFFLQHFGRLGPFTVFVLMGSGSALASGLLFWRLGLFRSEPELKSAVSWRKALRENWTYGRWLVGSTVLFSVSTQAQMFFVAGFLGLGAAGVLRAMQIPSLVMTQLTTAAGLLVLPSFSYDFGKGALERLRQKATVVSVSLSVGALCFAGLLALLAGPTERVLFNGRYAPYAWLMPVLALIPVCAASSIGYSMALRAFQKPHFDLLANAVAAPVGALSAFYLIQALGLAGATASMALSFLASSLVSFVSYRHYISGGIRSRAFQ
jgi:O-antigen/teichoic acid export membrane protein